MGIYGRTIGRYVAGVLAAIGGLLLVGLCVALVVYAARAPRPDPNVVGPRATATAVIAERQRQIDACAASGGYPIIDRSFWEGVQIYCSRTPAGR